MQKVVGSSPIIRSQKPRSDGVFVWTGMAGRTFFSPFSPEVERASVDPPAAAPALGSHARKLPDGRATLRISGTAESRYKPAGARTTLREMFHCDGMA